MSVCVLGMGVERRMGVRERERRHDCSRNIILKEKGQVNVGVARTANESY